MAPSPSLNVAMAVAMVALLGACAKSADETARPKFTPISSGGLGGEYDSYGGQGGEDFGGAAGTDSYGSDTGGAAGDSSYSDPGVGGSDPGVGGSDPGVGGVAGSEPGVGGSNPGAGGAVNAPGCGADGSACCAVGDTCADPKAQCCWECSGTPYYTCHCQDAYHDPGLCRVCCVVCCNGKVKADPLYVSGSSCQDAAQTWCKSTFGVGADSKSGWRAKCG